MWSGVFPALTTKFTVEDGLDLDEMERCFSLQVEAGVDGLIVCGSLGEAMALDAGEKLQILSVTRAVARGRPVLMTICESTTRRAAEAARAAVAAGADGLMVLPGVPYRSEPHETVAHLRAVAAAGGKPVMVYNNPVAYGVDVTADMFEAMAGEDLFVAVKESSDDVRRVTELLSRFGDRYDIFTGVDNLALESLLLGAAGWVAGLVAAFPHETVAIERLARAGRIEAARAIYRWFRPLLDLDVSSRLVQNIKLAEALAIGSSEHVRAPRLPLAGEERARIVAVIERCMADRPTMPVLPERSEAA